MALSHYGSNYHAANFYNTRYYTPEEAEEYFVKNTGGGGHTSRSIRKKWFRDNVIVDESIDEQDLNDIINIVLASGILDE